MAGAKSRRGRAKVVAVAKLLPSEPPPPPPSSSSSLLSSFLSIRFLLACVAVPYLAGWLYRIHSPENALLQSALDPLRLSLGIIGRQPKEARRALTAVAFELNTEEDVAECYERLLHHLRGGGDVGSTSPTDDDYFDPFRGVSFVLHRNGEPSPCGETNIDVFERFNETLRSMKSCPSDFGKYQFESFLTRFFHSLVRCPSAEPDRHPAEGFLGYCDMGQFKTPVLLDHEQLVPVVADVDNKNKNKNKNNDNDNVTETTVYYYYLPCHFHTRAGLRVTSLSQLAHLARAESASTSLELENKEQQRTATATATPEALDNADRECQQRNETGTWGAAAKEGHGRCHALHLYAVPAGRVFMFAPSHVGEIIEIGHVHGADPVRPLYLEVMSLNPRVFEIANFFSEAESRVLVDRALRETKETHRIKSIPTGASGYNVSKRRTSETGYDTDGNTALAIKRRSFHVLGFDEYLESHADGLQIVRYNLSKAYSYHMDLIQANDNLEHDYESAGRGGNRFATLLLYMTEHGDRGGGETVFVEGWPPGQAEEDRVDLGTAITDLRESGDGEGVLKHGSWEEDMVAKCRSRLSVKPKPGRAILFYSQHPNGQEDEASLHGGCPVLSGQKYAANLWVWNTPRLGYPGFPVNERHSRRNVAATAPDFGATAPDYSGEFRKVVATFRNNGETLNFERAELYHQDRFWSKLGHGDPAVGVETYRGHVWNLRVDGTTVQTWVIDDRETEQHFVV